MNSEIKKQKTAQVLITDIPQDCFTVISSYFACSTTVFNIMVSCKYFHQTLYRFDLLTCCNTVFQVHFHRENFTSLSNSLPFVVCVQFLVPKLDFSIPRRETDDFLKTRTERINEFLEFLPRLNRVEVLVKEKNQKEFYWIPPTTSSSFGIIDTRKIRRRKYFNGKKFPLDVMRVFQEQKMKHVKELSFDYDEGDIVELLKLIGCANFHRLELCTQLSGLLLGNDFFEPRLRLFSNLRNLRFLRLCDHHDEDRWLEYLQSEPLHPNNSILSDIPRIEEIYANGFWVPYLVIGEKLSDLKNLVSYKLKSAKGEFADHIKCSSIKFPKQIRVISLRGIEIEKSINLSQLSQLTSLRIVNCGFKPVAREHLISSFDDLRNLKVLNIQGKRTNEIIPNINWTNMNKLETLVAENNLQVINSSFSKLANSLRVLRVGYSKDSDGSILTKFRNLNVIDLLGCRESLKVSMFPLYRQNKWKKASICCEHTDFLTIEKSTCVICADECVCCEFCSRESNCCEKKICKYCYHNDEWIECDFCEMERVFCQSRTCIVKCKYCTKRCCRFCMLAFQLNPHDEDYAVVEEDKYSGPAIDLTEIDSCVTCEKFFMDWGFPPTFV